MHFTKLTQLALTLAVIALLLTGCGFRRKKYENPITKDTEQPDKVLYDKAIRDVEKGRYEVARLTLNTLMNTYDTSEFLAKAKLAIADSWMREGGSHALAQAEAEYKDFILFYPMMEESAEAQEKVCNIHVKQMEKPDRDPNHSLRAEDECRNLLLQFPNSKAAPRVQQTLRNIQEVIGDGEFRVGQYYHKKGSFPSAANRLETLVNGYPLYSQSDTALWLTADSYGKLGPNFRDKAAVALQRIVKDYPLSEWVEKAKQQLKDWEKEIPEPDPVAVARMKYEQENYRKPGLLAPALGIFTKGPDTRAAAKSGNPAMTSLRPSIPVSVPSADAAAGGATADVTVSTVGQNSALDTQNDARLSRQPGAQQQGEQPATPQAAGEQQSQQGQPVPSGNQKDQKKSKKEKKPRK